jgi:hypothetical protein
MEKVGSRNGQHFLKQCLIPRIEFEFADILPTLATKHQKVISKITTKAIKPKLQKN